MRIAINASFFRVKDIGGSGIYVVKLVQHLLNIDDSIEIVIFAPPDALLRFSENPLLEKVGLPRADRFERRIYYEQVFVPKTAKRKLANVILSPGTSGPLISSVPHVVVVNDFQHRYYPDNFSVRVRAFRKVFWELSAKRADAVIAISKFTKSDILRFLEIDERKIYVIYHGVDFIEPKKEVIESMDKRVKRPFMFLPARTYQHKGHITLIRAFEMIAERIPHGLVFCGAPDSAHEEIMRAIHASPFKKRILYLGSLEYDEVLALYRLADLLVFPSEFEGFGLPLLEAMVAGCPVVATNIASIPEVCGDAAILVSPRNVQALAEGIFQVLSDPELRKTLVERGKNRAKEFSWERCARETLYVLKKVAT